MVFVEGLREERALQSRGSGVDPKLSCAVLPNVKAQEIPSNAGRVCLHSRAGGACIQKLGGCAPGVSAELAGVPGSQTCGPGVGTAGELVTCPGLVSAVALPPNGALFFLCLSCDVFAGTFGRQSWVCLASCRTVARTAP